MTNEQRLPVTRLRATCLLGPWRAIYPFRQPARDFRIALGERSERRGIAGARPQRHQATLRIVGHRGERTGRIAVRRSSKPYDGGSEIRTGGTESAQKACRSSRVPKVLIVGTIVGAR